MGRSKLRLGRDVDERGGWRVSDPGASRHHATIRLVRSVGVYRIDDEQSLNGTFVDGVRTASAYLRPGALVRIGATLFTVSRSTPDWWPGAPPALFPAQALADRVAPHGLGVLLIGDTGAGKEHLARRIHERSQRGGDFVPVNCGALPSGLIASELFGHSIGAFSGATRERDGLFVRAHEGTLLLDEIAELPLELQPHLLRALQDGFVRPVGSDAERRVNVRVIAATHADLDRRVREGTFREDLLARLRGVTIRIPPLAERRSEILPLFRRFLDVPDARIMPCAAEALLCHAWPQNIRELEHAARFCAIMMDSSGVIDAACLPTTITNKQRADGAPPSREALLEALEVHDGNVAGVCRAFDCHRQQVYRWIELYGIDRDAFRGESASSPQSSS
ncbi:MAG: sigma 54-interacting transcriptional regulator [Deltaproteobacteria bacterium]